MNFDEPILTLGADTRLAVLAVLATATDQPLSGAEIGRRAGVSDVAALRALDDLAAGGLVGRLKCSNVSLHALYTDHVAADTVCELAALPTTLCQHVAVHAGAWQQPAATVAVRLPCPTHTDDADRAVVDLLIITDDDGEPATSWPRRADELAAQMWRWSGHHTHRHLRPSHEPPSDHEQQPAPWTLLAGHAPAALAVTSSPAASTPRVER